MALHTGHPYYLADLIDIYEPSRCLRSTNNCHLLAVPSCVKSYLKQHVNRSLPLDPAESSAPRPPLLASATALAMPASLQLLDPPASIYNIYRITTQHSSRSYIGSPDNERENNCRGCFLSHHAA